MRAVLSPLESTPSTYRNWDVDQRASWVRSVIEVMDAPAAKPVTTPKRTSAVARAAVTTGAPPDTLPTTALTRVSTRTAALLSRLGVSTIGDLLYLLPRRYLDYTHTRAVSDLQPDLEQTVVGRVLKASWVYPGGRRSTEVLFGDKTGTVKLLWFNQPWMVRTLPQDRDIVVSGTARVQVGDTTVLLAPNESTYVPVGSSHRLENPGRVPLTLIEVQCGDYVGEDDIVRFDDRYGRAPQQA